MWVFVLLLHNGFFWCVAFNRVLTLFFAKGFIGVDLIDEHFFVGQMLDGIVLGSHDRGMEASGVVCSRREV
ncbi:hypothetical protein TNCV_921851 [Trichonephila clavipes]|nr:hypothetical protein TNCV_921851 [Trichonephila clavipes]